MERDQKTRLQGELAAQYGTSSTAKTPGRGTQDENQDTDADTQAVDAAAQDGAAKDGGGNGLYAQTSPLADFTAPESEPKKKETGEGQAGAPGAAPTPGAAAPKPQNTGGIKVSTQQGGSSRTVVGVGERVTFSHKESGDWKASSSFQNMSSETSGESFTWNAPATPGSVTITHTGKGKPNTVVMSVLAPSGIEFKKMASVPVKSAGAGMKLNLIIQPTTVSFYNVQWKEQPHEAAGVTGYYADYAKQTGSSLKHDPYPQWLPMGAANNEVFDYARSEDKPKIAKDGKPPAWYEGGYDWQVPNKYRVTDGKSGDGEGQTFATVLQTARMDNTGRVTVSKGGASSSQTADGKAEGDIETFKTLDEAKAKLIPLSGNRLRVFHAIAWLENARSKGVDQQSIGFMIAAIKSANAQMYVSVQCTNTYKWIDADPVTVKIGSFTKSTDQFGKELRINTNKQKDFRVALNDFVDWGTATQQSIAPILITADGNDLRANVPFPFDTTGQQADGSNGRYLVTTALRDDVEKI